MPKGGSKEWNTPGCYSCSGRGDSHEIILAQSAASTLRQTLALVYCNLPKPLLEQLLVVGHGAGQVKEYFGDEFYMYHKNSGWGQDMPCSKPFPIFQPRGDVGSLRRYPAAGKRGSEAVDTHAPPAKAAATILTARMDDPGGYGRIIRSDQVKSLR